MEHTSKRQPCNCMITDYIFVYCKIWYCKFTIIKPLKIKPETSILALEQLK